MTEKEIKHFFLFPQLQMYVNDVVNEVLSNEHEIICKQTIFFLRLLECQKRDNLFYFQTSVFSNFSSGKSDQILA